jgi:cobalt/nickel transport protein
MKFRYTLEVLTIIAIVVFSILFLYSGSNGYGEKFVGTDTAGSYAIAELSGTPLENFQPLIPQWKPPGTEIESTLFALQAAIGGILVGVVFGFWISSHKKA